MVMDWNKPCETYHTTTIGSHIFTGVQKLFGLLSWEGGR